MLGAATSACCCAANGLSLLSNCCRGADCRGGGDENDEDGSGAPSNWVRLKYAAFLMVGYLLCLSVKDGVHTLITDFPMLKLSGCEAAGFKDLCYGHTYVYRICFALWAFFLVHFLCSLDFGVCCTGSGQRRFQHGFFCLKASLLAVLLFFTLFIGTGFFNAFAHLCVIGAGVFIVMQILILLDFAYEWNDHWANKSDEEPQYAYLLLLFTLAFYAMGFTLIGLMFKWFTEGEGCTLNTTLVTITLVAGLLYSLAALRLEHASVLPASIIFLYSAVVCFSAIQSGSDSTQCNVLWTPEVDHGLSGTVVISSLIAVFTLVYSCLSASSSRSAFTLVPQDEEAAADPADQPASSFALFHFVMVLAAMYTAMLLTSWSTDGEEAISGTSKAALWAKIIAQWTTIVAYCWTLIAPLVLTDREF